MTLSPDLVDCSHKVKPFIHLYVSSGQMRAFFFPFRLCFRILFGPPRSGICCVIPQKLSWIFVSAGITIVRMFSLAVH